MKPSSQALDETHIVKYRLANDVLRSAGSIRLQATGRSMLPTIRPGDTLVIEPAITNDVFEGDIVLFSSGRQFVAHRVVEKNSAPGGTRLQTQGDSVPCADSPVCDSNLLGRVSLILRNGRCIAPSRSLGFSERAVAALVRSSGIAARVVVGVHGMRQASHTQT